MYPERNHNFELVMVNHLSLSQKVSYTPSLLVAEAEHQLHLLGVH